MTDTFSWEGLNYKVPISDGGERKLLNDISGYVVPGKLTALMGESGAGKVGTFLPPNLSNQIDRAWGIDHAFERPCRSHIRGHYHR